MALYQQSEETRRQTELPVSLPTAENATSPLYVQEAASEETANVEPQVVTNLLATAARQNVQRRRLAFLGLSFAIPIALIAAFPGSLISILSYLFTVFLVTFTAARFTRRYRKTTLALAQMDDVRMVGPLIDRLRGGRKMRRTRRVVRQALMRLLPRLKASDAQLLSTEQKARLAQYLGHLAMFQRDNEFQVVILRALEQVGDAQAIPIVEKMAQRLPHSSAQEQVHAAAVECLPFLYHRAKEESARQTLLRAASQGMEKGMESGGELLRPAEGVIEVVPGELLRAAPFQESVTGSQEESSSR